MIQIKNLVFVAFMVMVMMIVGVYLGSMCFSFTLKYECFSRSLVVEDTLLSSSSSKSSSSSIFNVTWMNDEDVIIIKFNKSLMLVTDNILHTRMINIIY